MWWRELTSNSACHFSGVVLCCVSRAKFGVLTVLFVRSLTPNISNFDLSIGCKLYRPHHISPCNCGKTIYCLFDQLSYILMVKLIVQLLTIPLLSSYPFMPALSGSILQLALNCASFLKNSFSVSATILNFCVKQIFKFEHSTKYISSLVYLS